MAAPNVLFVQCTQIIERYLFRNKIAVKFRSSPSEVFLGGVVRYTANLQGDTHAEV